MPKTTAQLALMMAVALTSEPSADNYFTRQYNPEDKSELNEKLVQTVCFNIFFNFQLNNLIS
jgi:hypothetical protein